MSAAALVPPCVLVVDDELLVRWSVVEYLGELEAEIVEASNGDEALGILRQRPVTLLFTDIRMPGMTGIELAERAREMQPALKIVLATGYAFPHGLPGGVPVLQKPFGPDEVVRIVSNQLKAA